MRRISIFCLTLLLGLVACTQTKIPSTDEEKILWLRENALQVRSIEPSDEDFSDLYPLENIIGDARIVMLGEQSHGEGNTFLAKTRLIKFLHQEMGFDVLAFESGLYDCAKAWELLQLDEEVDSAVQQGIFGIWSQSEQVQPLISYLSEAAGSDYPLELAGFDSQFSGTASTEYLMSDLDEFLTELSISIPQTDWESFKGILRNLTQRAYTYGGKPIPEVIQQDKFLDISRTLRAEIASVTAPDDFEAELWLKILESIEIDAKQKWKIGSTRISSAIEMGPAVFQMRDIQMGHNLIWLANKRYPNRKLIVWAATFHTARNLDQIETADPEFQEFSEQVTVMGDMVQEELDNEVYTLGFTTYSGQAGIIGQPPIDLAKPSEGSFEDLVHRANLEYAVVDFRHPPKGGEWLQNRLVSRSLLGYNEVTANWPLVLDGMMFIRDMVPSTYINE